METLDIESHRNFAIARAENGEALIQPDTDGVWRYVYEDGTLDPKSHVDSRNPAIKLEAEVVVFGRVAVYEASEAI